MEWFTVYFTDGKCETVQAMSEAEARILAQAERIKAGLSYEIEDVYKGR